MKDSPVPDTSTGLLRNLAQGPDASRWTEFARLYEPVARYYLAGMRRAHPSLRPDLDDDVVQETFVFLVQAFPQGKYDRSKGAFHSFFRGVLENMARNLVKARDRVELSDALPERAEEAPDDDDAMRRELLRALLGRLFASASLSGRSAAIVRRMLDGETVVDLAREYGLTPNDIHQLAFRVRARLREMRRELERRGGDDLVGLLEALAIEEAAPAAPDPRA